MAGYYRRLRDLRVDKELTQQQAADIAGVSKGGYCNYELGIKEIPFSTVVKLAQLYNVSLDYIADLVELPYPIKGRNMYVEAGICNGN